MSDLVPKAKATPVMMTCSRSSNECHETHFAQADALMHACQRGGHMCGMCLTGTGKGSNAARTRGSVGDEAGRGSNEGMMTDGLRRENWGH